MRDFLVWKIPKLTPERIDEMFAEERFVDEKGVPVPIDAPFAKHSFIFFHRDLPDEAPPPGELRVLHQDERIVVLDKPHFTASIPRGRHVVYSAVVQARNLLDLPELAPAHRLDRLTAGVLMCTTHQEYRRGYQMLFDKRLPSKTYEAVGRHRDDLEFPLEVSSHLVKRRESVLAEEIPGQEPNAHTLFELIDHREHPVYGPIARYKVSPRTGKTHQIRVHMAYIGHPILGDTVYGRKKPELGQSSQCLHAGALCFQHPRDGHPVMVFAELPQYFRDVLDKLEKMK